MFQKKKKKKTAFTHLSGQRLTIQEVTNQLKYRYVLFIIFIQTRFFVFVFLEGKTNKSL